MIMTMMSTKRRNGMKKYFGALAAAVLTALCASGAGETRNGDIRSIEAVPNASFGYPQSVMGTRLAKNSIFLCVF